MSKNDEVLQNFKEAIFDIEASRELALKQLISIIPAEEGLKIAFRHFAICIQLYEKNRNAETWIRVWFASIQKFDVTEYKTNKFGSFYIHYGEFIDDAIMQVGSQLEMALDAYYNGDTSFCFGAITGVLSGMVSIRVGYRWSISDPKSWHLYINSTEDYTLEESSAIHNFRFSQAIVEYLQSIWLSIFYDIEDVLLS